MPRPPLRALHHENYSVYGTRKVWLALNRDGVRVARCTVEQLMKVLGLHGARRGRTMRTTRSDPAAPRPADLVERNFNPSRPDALWVADFSSRADLGRVRLHGVRHRRVQPAGFSHALPGDPIGSEFYLWALRP